MSNTPDARLQSELALETRSAMSSMNQGSILASIKGLCHVLTQGFRKITCMFLIIIDSQTKLRPKYENPREISQNSQRA